MTVTVPRGFRAAGVAAGLNAGGVLDVALVVNDGSDAGVAGVFTSNRAKASFDLSARNAAQRSPAVATERPVR
ncbi:hypothetical protein Vqi01_22530 [Micromonospora qiuiae]|uniref:Bifunctional ornithine acetyltransferase/N-acetylglutamate synthase n=1 Tax=Micromonospora qiuiae TaxID=502268 RepID=A0ABQ4JAA0_9ACTN|nr:hypothetical protein Vqi01_22530 [Micromonospora qiuiae]